MSLINLICPHCGGRFELDPERPLQSFWVCPYCGNRSLMQKSNGLVRLRGIIPGRGTQTESESDTPDYEFRSETPDLSASVTDPESDSFAPEKPAAGELRKPPLFISTGNPEGLEQKPRTLEAIIAEASAEPLPREDEPEPDPDLSASPAEPPESPSSDEDTEDRFEALCRLAVKAAESRDLPLFNSYSRQAIDCRPKDPRMYALRFDLTETADGFARATWASVGWFILTPRSRLSLIAQHLYSFNTALKYSKMAQQQELIRKMAGHLVRQAVDAYTELAELRCRKNLIFKKFKGRFRRSDLRLNRHFIDALDLINEKTCPLGHERLREAIRVELLGAPPKIARRFKRF